MARTVAANVTRLLAAVMALVIVADFGWILTHWIYHPDLVRHAEYLVAAGGALYGLGKLVRR
jgi:hypothetical protein